MKMLKPDGGARIRAEIHALEVRYEMTSAEMRVKFARGEIRDTADTARWLVLLKAVEKK